MELVRRLTTRRVAARAACVAVCAFGLAMVAMAVGSDAIDLQVYRAGGRAVLDGAPLYEGPLWGGMPFVYTPFAAAGFAPLAWLSPAGATAAVAVGNAALLVYAAVQCWRASVAVGPRRVLVLALLTSSVLLATEAIHANLFVGQVNLLLLVLILRDVLKPDAKWSRGIALGLAAGIKLTPLIFVVYLLLARRFKAALVAIATFLITVAAGFLALPEDSSTFWLQGTFGESSRFYRDVFSTHNQTLRGLLMRAGVAVDDVGPLWIAAAVVIAGVTLSIAVRAGRRGEQLLAATLCGMCGSAVSPWAWGHHWVWLLPLSVFLVSLVLQPGGLSGHLEWLAPAALLPLTFPWVRALADPPDGSGEAVLQSGPAAFFLSNLYVLIFGVTVIASVVHLRRAPVEPDGSTVPEGLGLDVSDFETSGRSEAVVAGRL